MKNKGTKLFVYSQDLLYQNFCIAQHQPQERLVVHSTAYVAAISKHACIRWKSLHCVMPYWTLFVISLASAMLCFMFNGCLLHFNSAQHILHLYYTSVNPTPLDVFSCPISIRLLQNTLLWHHQKWMASCKVIEVLEAVPSWALLVMHDGVNRKY